MFAVVVEELVGLTDSGLDREIRDIELQRRSLDARMAAAIAVGEARQLNAVDAHRSMSGYLRATCNWSDAEVARHRSAARLVDQLDGVGDAWLAGHIGAPQVNELAKAHGNVRVRDRLTEFAPMLLQHAEHLPFDDFRACVKRFVTLADTEGAHRSRDRSTANRTVRVAEVGGELAISSSGGDPLVTAELLKIFQKFTDAEYRADVDARQAEHGDDAPLHPLPRTGANRGFDALVEIFRRASQSEQPGIAPEPIVNIVVDSTTWAHVLAAAGLAPDQTLTGEPVDPFTGLPTTTDLLTDLVGNPEELVNRRCETTTGIQLHPHDVLRAALAGHVRRTIIDAAGTVIDHGRKQRLFTGAARDAAKLLIKRCEHPGCSLSADFCQVDHDHEWTDDGSTDQHNARIKCGAHNRAKHRRKFRTTRTADGVGYTTRADGTIILPVGVRPPVEARQQHPPWHVATWNDPNELARRTLHVRERMLQRRTG